MGGQWSCKFRTGGQECPRSGLGDSKTIMTFRNKKKHKARNLAGFDKLGKLEEAAFLIEGGEWLEAHEFLTDAVKRFPHELGFWEMLAAAAGALDDIPTVEKAFGKVVQFLPNHPDAWFWLAHTYGLDQRLGLAYRGFKAFLEKFPGDENCGEAATLLALAKSDLEKTIEGYGFPAGDAGIDLICLNDETQVLMSWGEYAKAIEKAEQLIAQMPDYAPARNNLSLIYYLLGDVEKAYETARSVLDSQPENFHALGNIVRYSVYLGKEDEARHFAVLLRNVESRDNDIWIKKIEAFTCIGDNQTVVDIYQQAVQSKKLAVVDSFGKHLAAYAQFRAGNEAEARKLWRKILKDDPNFDLASLNLEELELPDSERSVVGLPLTYWIPGSFIDELVGLPGSIGDGKNFDRKLRAKVSKVFAKHPTILSLFSMLLNRGDKTAMQISARFLDLAGTDETHAVLKDFAFSQNGSDELRYKTAMKLADDGIISNNVRLWSGGEWRDMKLMTFEITDKPPDAYPLKPKAMKLSEKGYYAMQDQKFELAEQYFKLADEAQGARHPSILYNLLTIEQAKGNQEIAEAELAVIVKEFPDYTFGALRLALIEVKNGNVEAAKRLTEKFHDKKKWHVGEVVIWLQFNVELALKEKEYASARMSLNVLKQFDDRLNYDYWEDMIAEQERIHSLPLFKETSRRK